MEIRNITFAPESSESDSQPYWEPTPQLRLRKISVSPHEEYRLRSGEVRPISNDLAAAILSKKGRAEITLKGIVVDRNDIGGRYVFWHEDSIVCNDLSARDRKIFYVVNPNVPDIIHLLTDTGAYIESLPARVRPEVLNTEQQQAEMRKQQLVASRAASRLQELHGEATKDALETLQANSNEMQRVIQTLPAPESIERQPATEPQGPARQTHLGTQRINKIRQDKHNAIAFGRAVRGEISERYTPPANETDAEDWSSNRISPAPQPTQTTPIESW